MAIFDPPQNPQPLTSHRKIWYRWLRRRALRLCQIWCKSTYWCKLPMGKWVKCNEIFIYLFIYTFFGNLPTGQTRRQIFMLDGSNDMDSRKGCAFFWGGGSFPCQISSKSFERCDLTVLCFWNSYILMVVAGKGPFFASSYQISWTSVKQLLKYRDFLFSRWRPLPSWILTIGSHSLSQ